MDMRSLIAAALLTAMQGGIAPTLAQPVAPETHSAPAPEFRQSPLMADLEAFADGVIAESMYDLDPTATLLSVVYGDEQFAKGYGVADIATGRRTDATTLFGVGSISKTFTWLAVMILVDEGKLDLDADVNGYLTAFQIPAAFGTPLTMNHLLAHRSGFEESNPWFFSPYRDADLAATLAASMPARVAAPGERTAYTNWGSALAALIVQNVSGQPYDDFVQQRILDPLGMVSTTLRDPVSVMPRAYNRAGLDARLATPYKLRSGLPQARRYLAFEPAYAMGSAALDARDAATYMRALLNGTRHAGGRLVSEQTWAAFQRRLFDDREGADDFVGGFRHQEIAGYAAFGHQGGSSFTASMKLIPELRMGVLIAVNSRSALDDGRALARMLVLRSQGRSFDALSLPAPVDTDAAKALAGKYSPNRRTFSRAERFADLGTDIIISANNDGSVVMSRGSQHRRFVPIGNDLWMDTRGERIKAYRDEDGKIFRLSGGSIDTFERMGPLESSSEFYLLFGMAVLFSITTLLGAWWRWGRARSAARWDGALRWLPPTVAIIWLTLAATIVWLTLVVAGIEPTQFQFGAVSYPPMAARVALTLTMLAAAMAGVQMLALVPVWMASGWSLWRRIHVSIYTVVLLLSVVSMWNWNMIGKPLVVVSSF